MNSKWSPQELELIKEFCQESATLLCELDDCLEKYDSDGLFKSFESYGQVIDRMMGAAKALKLEEIAHVCELGKWLGYKLSQSQDEKLANIITGIFEELNEALKKLIKTTYQGWDFNDSGVDYNTLVSRLQWGNEKLKHIERSSVSFKKENEKKTKGTA